MPRPGEFNAETWRILRALFKGPGTCRDLAARANVKKRVVYRRLWQLGRRGLVGGRQVDPSQRQSRDGWWSKRWWLTVRGFSMVRPTYRRGETRDERAA